MTPFTFQSQTRQNFDPDVSVIIPTYNRISLLEEALSSVFSQDFDGSLEIIIVDDNSQDKTSEIIREHYPQIRLITLERNFGWPTARNRAIVEARGKYIAGLDSDDLWEPTYLRTQVSALQDRDRAFAVSAIVFWYSEENCKNVRLQKPDLKRFVSPIHQLLVTSSFIFSPSSVVFPRKIFDEIGLYDCSFSVGADREFYSRCLIYNYHPVFTEQPLAVLRKHSQGQLTDYSVTKIELRKQSRLTYLEKLYPKIEEKQIEIPSFNRICAEIYSTAAREFFREGYYWQWLISRLHTIEYTSMTYVLFSLCRDLLRFSKKHLPARVLKMIRKAFLSNSLST